MQTFNAKYSEDSRWMFVDCDGNTTYDDLWHCLMLIDFSEEAAQELGYTFADLGYAEMWLAERDDFIWNLDPISPEIQQAVAAKDAKYGEMVNSMTARIMEKLQAIKAECLTTGAASGKDWSIKYVESGHRDKKKTEIKLSCLILYYYIPRVPEAPSNWIPAVYCQPLVGTNSQHVIEFLDPYSGNWRIEFALEYDICPFDWLI